MYVSVCLGKTKFSCQSFMFLLVSGRAWEGFKGFGGRLNSMTLSFMIERPQNN